uniref:WGS project CAEQ00000000 data, annotated contig 1328 n=1 Tax=Trypanosoma congolense (strain IL3000) TaxID=1068625 RepID=F9W5I4_TRYCI|nr:unnamed protein product [Trypanosoma congolense IL3000]
MFRYVVEVRSCHWAGEAPAEQRLEVAFHRSGVSFPVTKIPAEVVLCGSQNSELIFISACCGDKVVGCSETIEIGGIDRRVGTLTMNVRRTERETCDACTVELMWRVSEGSEAPSPRVNEEISAPSGDPAALPATLQLAHTATEQQQLPILRPQEQNVRVEAAAVHSRENGAQWCVNGPRYAPSGVLNYFVTSTQSVKGPEAWRNLYTSPAPLLVAHMQQQQQHGSEDKAPMEDSTRSKCGLPAACDDKHCFALEDIRRNPTNIADFPNEHREMIYQSRINVPWRRLVPTGLTCPSVKADFVRQEDDTRKNCAPLPAAYRFSEK